MSTEPLQTTIADSPAPAPPEEATAPAASPPAEESAPTANAIKASSALPSLPPRIDAGEDLDSVLGEVSRVFGTAAGHAAPLGALAEDHINDQLVEMTAVPSAESPERAEPTKQELPLDTAADLFRATPASEKAPEAPRPSNAEPVASESPPPEAAEPEPAAPAPTTDQPPADVPTKVDPPVDSVSTPEEPKPAPTTSNKFSSIKTRLVGTAKRTLDSAFQLRDRLPKQAKLAVGLLAAALLGWIGGSHLTRSAGGPTVVEKSSAPQTQPETSAEPAPGDKAKIDALEQQVQTAQHDREVAQHERDQARQRMQQSAVLLRTEQQSLAGQRARDEARRKQVLEEFQKAEEGRQLMELRAYDAQLARVGDCWQRSPGLAAALLEDPSGCPAKLRDFAWGYLYTRAKNDRATWQGTAPANAVAWAPDATLVATADQDGAVTLRDAVSGKPLASLPAHAGGVNALAFTQNGQRLASAGSDATVKLWNVPSRRLEATFFGHLGRVLSVAISPDSSMIVSGGDDGTVKFWDVASRQAVATRWGHPRNHEPDNADDPTRFVRATAFSPDGRLVASGSYQVVRIWGYDAGEKSTLPVADGSVNALAFSPDSTTLAIGSDGSITLRDLDSLLIRSGPQPVDAPVNALAFSSDGGWLAASSGERGLLFDRIVRPSPSERNRRTPARESVEPAEYDLAHPKAFLGHQEAVTGVAFAPSATFVATSGADGAVRLWDPRGGIVDKTRPDLVLRDVPRTAALAYSPDSRTLAIGTTDSIRLWDPRSGVEMTRLENRSGEITRLAFSPDGAHLASAGRDWPILIWTVSAQRIELALNGHTAGVNSLAYSADGTMLVSASDDGTVRLWNAANGQPITQLHGHAGPVLTAALSPDGKLAASGGADRTIRLWSVERKQAVATLAGKGGAVVSLAISPDGNFAVSAERACLSSAATNANTVRRSLRLWKLPAGKELLAFGSPATEISEVSFSPDSKTLAAAGPNGVTLWDPRTGELRATLRSLSTTNGALPLPATRPHAGWPIAFSPDGQSLATGGQTGASIWTAAPFASPSVEKTAALP